MKYKILKSFAGSQDGTLTEEFTAGTEAHLSDYLVSAVDPAWITPAVEIENKAIITEGKRKTKAEK